MILRSFVAKSDETPSNPYHREYRDHWGISVIETRRLLYLKLHALRVQIPNLTCSNLNHRDHREHRERSELKSFAAFAFRFQAWHVLILTTETTKITEKGILCNWNAETQRRGDYEFRAKKSPSRRCLEGRNKKLAATYSPTLLCAVPSAIKGLTSEFGMGSGVPPSP